MIYAHTLLQISILIKKAIPNIIALMQLFVA